jgi:hypothetical protein
MALGWLSPPYQEHPATLVANCLELLSTDFLMNAMGFLVTLTVVSLMVIDL